MLTFVFLFALREDVSISGLVWYDVCFAIFVVILNELMEANKTRVHKLVHDERSARDHCSLD